LTNRFCDIRCKCLGRGCNHYRVLDVSEYPDDVPVPSFAQGCAVIAAGT